MTLELYLIFSILGRNHLVIRGAMVDLAGELFFPLTAKRIIFSWQNLCKFFYS